MRKKERNSATKKHQIIQGSNKWFQNLQSSSNNMATRHYKEIARHLLGFSHSLTEILQKNGLTSRSVKKPCSGPNQLDKRVSSFGVKDNMEKPMSRPKRPCNLRSKGESHMTLDWLT